MQQYTEYLEEKEEYDENEYFEEEEDNENEYRDI